MPAELLGDLLLAGDRPGRTLAGARIGVGALAVDRQALAMTQAAIAAQIHQALDIHGDVAAQIALDLIVSVDDFADAENLVVCQFVDATLRRDANLRADGSRPHRANAKNITKGDLNALLRGNVHTSNTGHAMLLKVEIERKKPRAGA